MKKVSVVIPAYNAATWIGETLQSVLAQDYGNVEVIVVDDGSKDNTASVVDLFPTVRYEYKANGGTATARNLGIRLAQGDYIAFLDADDLWLPGKLSLQMRLIDELGVEWVYSDAYAFDNKTGQKLYSFRNNLGQYSGDVLKQLFIECFIPSPTPVISKSVFDKIGYFNESGDVFNREDWEMWLRIARLYPLQFVNRPLAMYRVHETSKTGGNSPVKTLDEQLKVIEILASLDPARLEPLKNKSKANACKRAGCALLAKGKSTTARELFRRAMFLDPYMFDVYGYYFAGFLGNAVFEQLYKMRCKLRAWRCQD